MSAHLHGMRVTHGGQRPRMGSCVLCPRKCVCMHRHTQAGVDACACERACTGGGSPDSPPTLCHCRCVPACAPSRRVLMLWPKCSVPHKFYCSQPVETELVLQVQLQPVAEEGGGGLREWARCVVCLENPYGPPSLAYCPAPGRQAGTLCSP